MQREDLGWDLQWDHHFQNNNGKNRIPARVSRESRGIYTVWNEAGEWTARVAGRFQHQAISRSDFPAVGDWVVIELTSDDGQAVIFEVLPRRSTFSRKAVMAGGPAYGEGKTEEQILAVNVDIVFLVSGLDGNFNSRRIERYLSIAWDSGARPVIVLNKADVCESIDAYVQETAFVAHAVPIITMSAHTGQGVDELKTFLGPGKTAAFLGSSGVGKSSIINALLGQDKLRVTEVREDESSRGRHTTTHRELILLPVGGLVIDTPGMREISLWGDGEGLSRTFDDVEELIAQCRFSDCRHQTEPGCAVRDALENGELKIERFNNYLKLQREIRSLALRKNDREARRQEKAFSKKIQTYLRDHHKYRKKEYL